MYTYTRPELETGNGSIIVNSIQDVVSAIQNQTKTIIDYLSTMNFNNSSGFKKMSMLPSMGNTKVTLSEVISYDFSTLFKL